MEGFPACLEKRLGARIDRDRYRHAARLPRDVRGQREQVAALVGERGRLLPLDAAGVDALLQVHRPAARGIERRVARRDSFHAFSRVTVAIEACAIRSARLALKQGLAVEHPQRARITGVVVLHGARLAAHELVAGAALGQRDFTGGRGILKEPRGPPRPKQPRGGGDHSAPDRTTSGTGRSVSAGPWYGEL